MNVVGRQRETSVSVVNIAGDHSATVAELIDGLPVRDDTAYVIAGVAPLHRAPSAALTIASPRAGERLTGRTAYILGAGDHWRVVGGRWVHARDPWPSFDARIGVESASAEITRLRRAERLESLGMLAGGIAHELNNALAAIMGFAELALDDTQDVQEDLREVLHAAGRARDMVTRLLAFSGRADPVKELVDVNHVIGLARADAARSEAGLTALTLEAEPTWAWLDPALFRQALAAIVGHNPRGPAAPPSRSPRIETANVVIEPTDERRHLGLQPGSHVRIRVDDDGPPLDPAIADHLFDPFFNLEAGASHHDLGLAAAFGIVKAHDGLLECQVQPRFNRFEIHIPRARGDETSTSDRPAEARPGGETVLFVDDEAAIRQIAARSLGAAGYNVLLAESGEDALRRFAEREEEIDAVLLDLVMPGLSGSDCMGRLLHQRPDLPVVIVSGDLGPAGIAHLMDRGARTFLAKPFRRDGLLRVVGDVLTDRRR